MKKQMIRVTHLTLHERIVIQTGITNLASKEANADTLGRPLLLIARKPNVIDYINQLTGPQNHFG